MASDATKILGVLLGVTFAAVLLAPTINVALGGSGDVTVQNETVAADYDNYVDLEGYDVNSNSETVYGFNDTSGAYEEAVSPGDYAFDYVEGRIRINSSSTLIQDGEDVKVTYTYARTSGSTTTVVQLIPMFLGLLIMVVLASEINGRM